MVSGIEVADLVLRVVPLLITALEHYEAEAKALKTPYFYRRELSKSSAQKLKTDHLVRLR
jgi:hypothetical protein